ncbi:ABC transporter permease subunit [Kibdelosporangium lantanae]|uniref:ABC transporter permease subunit n=1 Tax=Kibdelosporangium lantanae TaxID=1497396 RepID=A0ABW3M672_9PSEU
MSRRKITLSPSAWLTWAGVAVFLVFVAALVVAVVVSSFGTVWLGTWLPNGFTGKWWEQTWSEFGLGGTLLVTMEVALLVVLISVLLGVPTAYVLARRDFPGKRLVSLLLLLPLLVPPITYGIPLATLLYQWGLGGNIVGVVLANVVPSLPFVVLTMTPFVEQVDRRVEDAARTLGAGTPRIMVSVLGPLLLPVTSLVGWITGALIGGAVVVEQVFSRQGLGRLVVMSINGKDIPVVAGVVLVAAVGYVLINILVDLLYLVIDPRLRGAS